MDAGEGRRERERGNTDMRRERNESREDEGKEIRRIRKKRRCR